MAQADVRSAQAKAEQAKAMAKNAEIQLGYMTIRAPDDPANKRGPRKPTIYTVIARRVNVGQTVVAGLNAPSLYLLAKDLGHMLVIAAVNEADIGDIHVGQPVTFTVDAYRDRTFEGKVSQIRLDASMLQNVVTYQVVINVTNPDEKLMPYMTAKLQFEVARRSAVVLVPNQALRWQPGRAEVSPSVRDELEPSSAKAKSGGGDAQDGESEDKVELGTPAVWVVAEDGFVRPVRVKTGLTDGVSTEVVGEGLEVGDAVVTSTVRAAEPDFVSGFISKVTNTKK